MKVKKILILVFFGLSVLLLSRGVTIAESNTTQCSQERFFNEYSQRYIDQSERWRQQKATATNAACIECVVQNCYAREFAFFCFIGDSLTGFLQTSIVTCECATTQERIRVATKCGTGKGFILLTDRTIDIYGAKVFGPTGFVPVPRDPATVTQTRSCEDKIKATNPNYDASTRLKGSGALWDDVRVVCRDCGDCEIRDILLVLRNVILFIVAGSGAFGVVIFIYGAFMMALSRGDSSRVSKAKEIMVSTIIAFIVVVCAWLIVNTVIGVITGGENLFPTDSGGFSWFRINPN
jgi:hypothetical protein